MNDTCEVRAEIGKGITIADGNNFIELKFDMHVSDVLPLLGNPNKQHVGRHLKAFYFLNYLQLGFDLAFSVEEHRLKQIVLHSNHLLDPKFGFYDRC